MSEDGRLPWSEEQWAEMQQLVQDSARRARVASSFLPLHGPLPPGQSTVPALAMANSGDRFRERPQRGESELRLEIDDGKTLRLTTIACDVYLKSQQAEDPSLSAARDLLGRAADIIGRLEDAIIFHGHPPDGPPTRADGDLFVSPEIYTVHNSESNLGLLDPPLPPIQAKNVLVTADADSEGNVSYGALGQALVGNITNAIQWLEQDGHYGPFACVLGDTLYRSATTPNPNSLVLPSDRITPFLDGPLYRSSVIGTQEGVVIALAGAPVDVVVGQDLHVGFLQLSLEPRYVLRVSERFVLRIKQPSAICRLEVPDATFGVLKEDGRSPSGGPAPGVAPAASTRARSFSGWPFHR